MYKILTKKVLNPTVTEMTVEAPYVARAAHPGQFVILRPGENSERIPLTVAGYDRAAGWVRIIFQTVGATTLELSAMNPGDLIADFAGPLGMPTRLEGLSDVCIVGGGVGCAIALPLAEALHAAGARVTSIIGFRTRELVLLEKEFAASSETLYVMTDDGSYGEQGNVCLPLGKLLTGGRTFEKIIAVGPLVMMKYVVETARPTGIPCDVSMNPIMIDGTGMCGGCRLTLCRGGERVSRFACVDGPDFNGYEVDFDEAISRASLYRENERRSYDAACRLLRQTPGPAARG